MGDNGSSEKKILWYSLAFMAFSTVWGFANVINGFRYYNGLQAVSAWILIFIVYFIPYALMVGELGSAFKNAGGGVSSWIHETVGPRMAFYAGWTYWVVHLPYISQKPTTALVAASWMFFRDGRISAMNPVLLQVCCLVVFFIALWLSSQGINWIKKISSIAGTSMFVMSLLFIVMMLAAPALTGNSFAEINWSPKTFLPTINPAFFLNMSILVLAVGGCEKISPYVNKMKSPAKDFPRGMIMLAVMIVICAILGTIALGMMFGANTTHHDLLTNGAYYAFQRVGQYYHLGDTLVIIYALAYFIGQFAVMVLSIDAPLRMLLDSADRDYIPHWLTVQNKHGSYKNGQLVVAVIGSILILIPAFGISSVDHLIEYLIKLNSVCMPLRYLWVFVAYIALKRLGDKYHAEYRFVKNKKWGIFLGAWCFFVTAFACLGGIVNVDGKVFELVMNSLTPIILLAIGAVLPVIARHTNTKQPDKSDQMKG